MTRTIVLDCDPANDDGLAILAAAGMPELTLLAITTVAGHARADDTARNAAICAAVAGLDSVPVSVGSAAPLVRDQIVARILDHEAGLDSPRDDLPAVELDPRHSVEVLRDAITQHPGTVIVATGPLTNLAVLLRQHPDLAPSIGGIITLGGSWGLGNKTPAAEFNYFCDPEAAELVFGSGVPITMIPVDALRSLVIGPELLDAVARIGGRAAEFAVELMTSLGTTHRSGPGPLRQALPPLLDPVAVLLAADPSLAETVAARVDIEVAGRLTYGRSVVDFTKADSGNATVVLGVDLTRTAELFVTAIRTLSERSER